MRIRTDGDYAHRADTIEAAAERLGVNKTRAVLIACDVVGDVLDGIEGALEHEGLPPRIRREMVEEIETRYIEIEVQSPQASVRLD